MTNRSECIKLGKQRCAFVLVAALAPLAAACNTTAEQTGRPRGQQATVAVDTTSVKRDRKSVV